MTVRGRRGTGDDVVDNGLSKRAEGGGETVGRLNSDEGSGWEEGV